MFALTLALLITETDFLNFDYLEYLTYDMRVRARPTPGVSGHVVPIAVDRATQSRLGRTPSISDHMDVLKRLQAEPPRATVYVLNPNNLAGTQAQFQKFAQLSLSIPNFFVAVNDLAPQEDQHKLRLKPPLEKLPVLSGPKTYDRKIFAKDDVTRRMIVTFQDQLTLHAHLAQLWDPPWRAVDQIRGLFSFLDSKQVLIQFRPAGTYQPLAFMDVLSGDISPSAWSDRLVLIGATTGEASEDYIRSPFSRSILGMSMLETHANMFDTLILNQAPVRAPYWFNLFLTALVALLTVRISLILRPTRGILTILSVALIYSTTALALFLVAGFVIVVAQPLIALFISYYFFIPYRLILENRRSWEYYQKNQLLTQVEELKNNFMSMMSHDLKTPLARIQGMTEVILTDSQTLSPKQKQAVATIRGSSDELLNLISSILDLGRIESTELKLQISSKDVNTLLQEAIVATAYLAEGKSIRVIAELEPLFSIPVDGDLVRQVFVNLIENAIKYSPEGSQVLVSSDEAPGRVIVQIADQGPGISEEELPHIFSKFYRSRDVKASKVKGTGLGLYLARYFVELHRGRLSVDSRLGQGTTMTVELPNS